MMNAQNMNGGMSRERFEQIAARFAELDRKQTELRRERFGKLYNTPGNSHHPVAFASLEDALAHEDLTARMRELELSKQKLSNRAEEDGFPVERWIKLEGPDTPDDEATGIILGDRGSGTYELMIEAWSLVLADG